MKTGYGTILVLAMTAILLTTPLTCGAVEKEEENIWSEDLAKRGHGRFELTEEKIERIMNQLIENDPEKAKELKQLKEKDFEKFKAELRETMRQQFDKRFREHRVEHPARSMRKHGRPFGHDGGTHSGHDKYINWLKENYAEEAEKLAELSQKDADLYWKQFAHSFKKYGRIAEAAKENLQLAELLKEDLVLKQQRDELLEEIKTAGDDEKEELVEELKEVINRRFDLIVKRKQMEYEQLLKRLERLKKEVEQKEAKVEKWKEVEFKNESVKARLEELLGKADEFKW